MICSPLSPMEEPTSSHLAAELAFFSTANDLISRSTTILMGHSSISSPWYEARSHFGSSRDLYLTLFTPATNSSDVSALRGLLTACSEPLRFTQSSIRDRKSTRLNSSHANISYAVFCLKKKKY